jgi:hypothetical protein
MSLHAILLPLFVEVILTFGLMLWLGVLRRRDLGSGAVAPEQVALREPNWSRRVQQVSYSFSNQFELPVLFYVLTILALVTRHADFIFVVLAWVFVLFRWAHAFEHVTSNRLMLRGALYGVAALALIVMWIVFIVRVLLGM